MIALMLFISFLAGVAAGIVLEAVLERNDRDRRKMDERLSMVSK